MLYAFLGSLLAGSLATALLLWRQSVLAGRLAVTAAALERSQARADAATEELRARSVAFVDQLARQRDQIDTLRTQRDEALTQLAKTGAPGSITDLLRMRNVPKT